MDKQWRLDTPAPASLGELQAVLEKERDHFLATSSVRKAWDEAGKEYDIKVASDESIASARVAVDAGIAAIMAAAPLVSEDGTRRVTASIATSLYADGRRTFSVGIDQAE
jgi:hypothetical protein